MEEHAVESNNSFQMRPHGYLFVTKNNNEAEQLYKQAKDAELLGGLSSGNHKIFKVQTK